MKLEKTPLEKVMLLTPEVFEDHRGEYVELYNEELFHKLGLSDKFLQDDISVSGKDVLRGIHGDNVTTKLVTCLLGRMYLVIVDCDESSSTFGKWTHFTITEKSRQLVYVPPKHGVAHLALSDRIIFHYKQSTYYDPSSQFTIKWDDPKYGIFWPIKNPILSRRDESGRYV